MTEKINCPFCNEEIDSKTRRCQHCGSILKRERYLDREERIAHTFSQDRFETKEDEDFLISPPRPDMVGGPTYTGLEKDRLSNGAKVFLSVMAAVIPGLGQVAGVIFAIIFMNDENDEDKRSFGAALLVASLAVFVTMCLFMILLVLTLGRLYSNIFFHF